VFVQGSHLVLGTAGHIDHGKTSLVKALTGIDTDRLKEEQERGITIELGFAHLTLPDGSTVAVVDVPGHERFVRTMVAGAVGLDAVLLVVAADEGVMPQTREHLDICELLGLRAGVVALSKCDTVDAELREVARQELRESLRGTFLAVAPIVACSARTGEGLAELVATLAAVLASVPGREADGVPRLPVDRVFALRGFGTVATGTLWSGRLTVGDELIPVPGPGRAALDIAGSPAATRHGAVKVRGLHVHGQAVTESAAGQRTAVNLVIPREAVARGDTLVRARPREQGPELLASLLIDAELSYLPVARDRLPRRANLLFHAAGAQRLAQLTLLDRDELKPGEQALAQLQLDAPLVLLPGDRFVLRGFAPQLNHGTTVGGGTVLRTLAVRQRRGAAPLLQTLREVADTLVRLRHPGEAAVAATRLIELELQRRGPAGASLPQLRMVIPVGETLIRAALRSLCDAGSLLALGEPAAEPDELLYVSRATADSLAASLLKTLAGQHKREPGAAGFSRATLRSQLTATGAAGSLAQRLFQWLLDELARRGQLVMGGKDRDKDLVRLASHQVASDDRERVLAERLTAIYAAAGLGPPRLDELPARLGQDLAPAPKVIASTVESLVRSGALVRIQDFFFSRPHVEALRQRLVRHFETQREVTTSQWKELVGQSRKFAIPLGEYFDAEKLTMRVGESRRLRGR